MYGKVREDQSLPTDMEDLQICARSRPSKQTELVRHQSLLQSGTAKHLDNTKCLHNDTSLIVEFRGKNTGST